MKFGKLESNPNLVKIQEDIIEFWKKDAIFEKSLKGKSKQNIFVDGPPFPTGTPHHGTVLSSFMKDMIARFWTMQGYSVPRVWGWDCHGLPTEAQAEKKLGLTDKKQIENEIGIAKFNQACYDIVSGNNETWRKYVNEMARWVDYDNSYKTMNKSFMESVIWAFATCYEKGLIYEDHRVTPYCYRCETALSISDTRESDSTRPKQDTWALARFKTDEKIEGKDVYLMAWTTTPWTLPSNLALAVGADMDYVFVQVEDAICIAGKDGIKQYEKLFGKNPKVVKTVKGKELVGTKYEPLFPYFAKKADEGAFRVIIGDFVTVGDGVGIVHIAPGFGEDDYWVCKKAGVPFVCPVDERGMYTSEVTDFAGQNVMEANGKVLRFLKDNKKVVLDGTMMHNYPHCWRCKTPLIYKAMEAWYFNVEKIKDRMMELNQEINWIPNTVKDGRFGNWLANARDWNISRNRYWSTPIPVWKCDCCKNIKVLGSTAEIEKLSGKKVERLHRQFLDEIHFPCDKCGGKMSRVSEVLDCWFESGSVPFAQHHYPFENKEKFDKESPCDFIVEYTGQIRGWFYVMHVLSVALFDKIAFKNCVVHGTILDNEGKKLSKSSKNYTDSMTLMKTLGTDAYRLYLFRSNCMILGDLVFDDKAVKEQIQKILLPLYNCTNFFVSYAILDGFEPKEVEEIKPTNELDAWILARLYEVEKYVTKNMLNYQIDEYVEPIVNFIDDLSNWYLRRSRRRFWESEKSKDKMDAYKTTYFVLTNLCRLLAPAVPLTTEYLYKHLTGKTSVHLENWPDISKKYKNDEVVKQTKVAQRIINLARVLRERQKIKVRQPLASLGVAFANEEYKAVAKKYESVICEEINIKKLNILENVDKIATVKYLPNFESLKKYGGQLKQITQMIREDKFKRVKDTFVLTIDGQELVLSKEDVLVRYEAKEGIIESDFDIVASLDITLTTELLDEGMAREVVRFVQESRKQLGCDIVDRIKLSLTGDVPTKWVAYINEETLSDNTTSAKKPSLEGTVEANDKKVAVKIFI